MQTCRIHLMELLCLPYIHLEDTLQAMMTLG